MIDQFLLTAGIRDAYIFQNRCIIEFHKLLPEYFVHCINITSMGPIRIMNSCTDLEKNTNKYFTSNRWLAKGLPKLLTCKVEALPFASNSSHHHMRTIKGMHKVWRESCPLPLHHNLVEWFIKYLIKILHKQELM